MQLILWIIGGVLIVLIFAFVKIRYLKHKISWIFILILIFFIYGTFMASIIGKDINFNTYEGVQSSIKLYLSWLGNAFENAKVVTGNAVKLNWETNITKMVN